MSVHLQRLRVIHTTSMRRHAATDDRVDLQFFLDPNAFTTYPHKGWRTIQLDSARDDRQRGAVESYEEDFTEVEDELGRSIGGTAVPPGIAFENFARVRSAVFFLRIAGGDWWRAESYRVDGLFKEFRLREPPAPSRSWIGDGSCRNVGRPLR